MCSSVDSNISWLGFLFNSLEWPLFEISLLFKCLLNWKLCVKLLNDLGVVEKFDIDWWIDEDTKELGLQVLLNS